MFKALALRALRRFAKRYDYDTTYMQHMLREAPGAFYKFALTQSASAHRKVVPAEAYFAVKQVAALATDCGPCTQLCVRMAEEAGVDMDQIEGVLTAQRNAMTEATAVGYDFAAALAWEPEELASARERVRKHWGDAGVVELSLCFTMSQTYPTLKTAMGFGACCASISVGGRSLQVARPESMTA